MRSEIPQIGSISRITFGCAAVGGRVSERVSLRSMAVAFEAGVTTFDIARSYGYGESERILGDFLKGRRARAEVITKAGILAPRPSRLFGAVKFVGRKVFAVFPSARTVARPALGRMHAGGHFEPDQLEQSLAASLRALRTDYVDALLLHACDADTLKRDEVREKMESFVSRGMARRVGVASGAREAVLWAEQGGDPSAELPASELGELRCAGVAGGLWLANQPLGGGASLRRIQAACTARGLDARAGLAFLLKRPLEQGASTVVLSMLSHGHAEHALKALSSASLGSLDRQYLEDALKAGS